MTKNTSSPDKSSKHGTKKSSSSNECRLQYDDRKYVDRGRLFMLQINKEIMTHGLEKMNCGKVGRPFTFSNACVAAAVSVPKRHRYPIQTVGGCDRGNRWQGKCAYILGISEKDDKAQLYSR